MCIALAGAIAYRSTGEQNSVDNFVISHFLYNHIVWRHLSESKKKNAPVQYEIKSTVLYVCYCITVPGYKTRRFGTNRSKIQHIARPVVRCSKLSVLTSRVGIKRESESYVA